MKKKYIPTGNEFMALPRILESDASIEDFTFLHMGYKGLIDVCGSDQTPFLKPMFIIDGKHTPISEITWDRKSYWIPSFRASAGCLKVEGIILSPINERGFIYRIVLINDTTQDHSVTVGFSGCWRNTYHAINESKEIKGEKHVYESGWNHSIVFDMRIGTSQFAFAPIFDENVKYMYGQTEDDSIEFVFSKDMVLKPGISGSFNFYFGIGYEEVAAATSAKQMLRIGFEREYVNTVNWLDERIRNIEDLRLEKIMNTNMFFNFFYASGITLDTEEFVLVTSRSPRYYVSAAYWDRDSLLWSFPSVLLVDSDYARQMLEYVFTKQIRNVGIHSRYIDGTVLEPGFELDELCAPIIALYNYICKSGDRKFATEPFIMRGVEYILKILSAKKHPHVHLYETMLQPTDDMHVYKYITYDNVLVWKALTNIAEIYSGIWSDEILNRLIEEAEAVKGAIYKECVRFVDGNEVFAWSVDLEGNFDINDEPPGSLLLLPFYGFCDMNDTVYKNTVKIIKRPDYPYSFADCPIAEIGCPHAPHPWVLSIANSLLSGNRDKAVEHLLKCQMDNGIACESVDEYTGESVTGDAFATCAGFLAYSIYESFNRTTNR